jgi:hypothetical protein
LQPRYPAILGFTDLSRSSKLLRLAIRVMIQAGKTAMMRLLQLSKLVVAPEQVEVGGGRSSAS